MPEAFNTVGPRSRPKVEHLDRLVFLSREKQTVSLEVQAKMIEITREARHRGCFDQLQRQLLLGLHRQRTQSQYHRVSLQRLSQFIPPEKCWRPVFSSPSFVYLDDCMVRRLYDIKPLEKRS